MPPTSNRFSHPIRCRRLVHNSGVLDQFRVSFFRNKVWVGPVFFLFHEESEGENITVSTTKNALLDISNVYNEFREMIKRAVKVQCLTHHSSYKYFKSRLSRLSKGTLLSSL
jgi:hypothetical protein